MCELFFQVGPVNSAQAVRLAVLIQVFYCVCVCVRLLIIISVFLFFFIFYQVIISQARFHEPVERLRVFMFLFFFIIVNFTLFSHAVCDNYLFFDPTLHNTVFEILTYNGYGTTTDGHPFKDDRPRPSFRKITR